MSQPTWPAAQLARFEEMRAQGYTVELEGNTATITYPRATRPDPPTCPWTGAPMKRADWDPFVWVPDV
jgi:hypothetical protein